MPAPKKQKQEMDDKIELRIHQFMAVLYEKHLPDLIQKVIEAHNTHVDAHESQFEFHTDGCPHGKKLNRAMYVIGGVLFGVGLASGAGLARLGMAFF